MNTWVRTVALTMLSFLAVTTASAQLAGPPPGAFSVTVGPEYDPVASRFEGVVHNASEFRVTNVRVRVRGLGADGRVVGDTVAWAIGDILPDGESTFVFDAMPDAVGYESAVLSYDLVSEPAAARQN